MKKQNSKKTASAKSQRKTVKRTAKPQVTAVSVPIAEEHLRLPLNKLRVCPLNYRKSFNERELQELSESIKLKGVIQDILVRPVVDEVVTHEVVCGERRFRASLLAGMEDIPVKVRELTDGEVKEIMFAENLHRENPHPMHEALGIADMISLKKKVEHIALSICKTPVYVYQRMKLTNLIEEAQDMFLADKMNISQALQLALLPKESQEQFMKEVCSNWKEEHFVFPSGRYLYDRYRNDLKKAPFDTKDKSLMPEMGACTKCPFNSATMTSLFPDEAKTSICMNHSCFAQKCDAAILRNFTALLEGEVPQISCIVRSWSCYDRIIDLLSTIPVLSDLPVLTRSEVNFVSEPQEPAKEDYEDYEDAEEEYAHALIDYQAEVDEYELLLKGNSWKWALYVEGNTGQIRRVTEDQRSISNSSGRTMAVTAKAVQEAIKAGTVTRRMLLAEVQRLDDLENRNKRNDSDKVHTAVFDTFVKHESVTSCSIDITDADRATIPFLLYKGLSYRVDDRFWEAIGVEEPEEDDALLAFFQGMNESQLATLARIALADRQATKMPRSTEAVFLHQICSAVGVDIPGIQKAQDAIAEKRQESYMKRREDALKRADGLPEDDSQVLDEPVNEADEQEEYDEYDEELVDMEEDAAE